MTINETIKQLKESLPNYIVQDQKQVYRLLLRAHHVCFLDTCFISRLSVLPDIQKAFIAAERGCDGHECDNIVVVLTTLVLYELKDSEKNAVQAKNLDVLNQMSEYGYTIILVEEESVCDNIGLFIGKPGAEWNRIFANRLIENKPSLTKLWSVIEQSKSENCNMLKERGIKCGKTADYIRNTILDIKALKINKDSMAEELIAVAIFFIAELLIESKRNVILFCSHDYPAIRRMKQMIHTSYNQAELEIRMISFVSFIEYMVHEGVLTDAEELRNVIEKVLPERANVLVIEDAPSQEVVLELTRDEILENMISRKRQIYIGKGK